MLIQPVGFSAGTMALQGHGEVTGLFVTEALEFQNLETGNDKVTLRCITQLNQRPMNNPITPLSCCFLWMRKDATTQSLAI